jgi:hypothetical protein
MSNCPADFNALYFLLLQNEVSNSGITDVFLSLAPAEKNTIRTPCSNK